MHTIIGLTLLGLLIMVALGLAQFAIGLFIALVSLVVSLPVALYNVFRGK